MQDRSHIQRLKELLRTPITQLGQEEFICFLLLCRHAPSPPHPFSLPPLSSIDVDGALRSSAVAESLLVSLGRRPNATRDAVGNQRRPSLHGSVGYQLGVSHVLQTDGIVLSSGECSH